MDDNRGPHESQSEDRSSVSSSQRPSSASGVNSQSNSQQLNQSQTSDNHRKPLRGRNPTTIGYGTILSKSRTQLAMPEANTSRPGRLSVRRQTSIAAPRKGEAFSVDDGEDEVAQDRERKYARHASGTLRRQPSTLRRRPTAAIHDLPRVNSDEEYFTYHHTGAVPRGEVEEVEAVEAVETPVEEGYEDAETEEDDEDENVEEENNSIEEEDDLAEGDEQPEITDDIADEVEDDDDISEAESFTLRDRQTAINKTHPFGIRIWKPALYKKERSVEKTAEGDIHSSPGGNVSPWLKFVNLMWTLLFGWWLALIAAIGALICWLLIFSQSCRGYGVVLWNLAGYLLYPFGKYIKLTQDEAYLEEDEGEGRSFSEYEQWQSGDIEEGGLFFGPLHPTVSLVGHRRESIDSADENDSLLGRAGRRSQFSDPKSKPKRRLFGRGEWNFGRVVFFLLFYGVITPCLIVVSGLCWFLVVTIPMARTVNILFYHLRKHPLALSFHSDSSRNRDPDSAPSSILLCTYRAAGLRYWKYTIDGTNIFLINLLGLVAFVILDYFILKVWLGWDIFLTNSALLFAISLFSVIPLAYFIGQAVASISAQSSMGVGATINAFFSTVVEVFLYCVALKDGKSQLVEGSVIGSVFAGILFLPGLSMCFGALKRKTQRFNVKSAGVTSTMLLFAVIGAFGPTLFYQIYGSHEINCYDCADAQVREVDRDCQRCFFAQTPALQDPFYIKAVRPYTWFSAAMLFLSYVIGLIFTLRTHAAIIWNSELDEKRLEKSDSAISQPVSAVPLDNSIEIGRRSLSRRQTLHTTPTADVRDSQLYKRILGQSLKHMGITTSNNDKSKRPASHQAQSSLRVSTRGNVPDSSSSASREVQINGISEEDNQKLIRQVAKASATAATVAANDAAKAPRKVSEMASTPARSMDRTISGYHPRPDGHPDPIGTEAYGMAAGAAHDAPNWSRMKSAVILLVATIAYAIIAEILVDTVDSILENVDIDEKFLGITLFALVPNTTEFLNAISFAMNGNIALSMEIGSAYALQVCLLQVPALVLFSALYTSYMFVGDSTGNVNFVSGSGSSGDSGSAEEIASHAFTLIFPQWDMVTVILCVVLLSYVYSEGKSNYFKGSILILSYLVVLVGFYFSGYDSGLRNAPGSGAENGVGMGMGMGMRTSSDQMLVERS